MKSLASPIAANDDWLAGVKAGDSGVMASLRARIRRSLGVALGGRSDVSDVDLDDFTQEAVLRILERLNTFRGDSSFTTWATAVAIRVGLTALRRRRWSTESLDERLDQLSAPASAASPDHASSSRGELFRILRTAIAEELTPRQRQVLLAELDGIPQVVLADRLASTPGAVYKTSHDARKKLKSVLSKAGFDAATVQQVLAEKT